MCTRGIMNKQLELRNHLIEHKVEIMLLNELKLKDNHKLFIRNYSNNKLRPENTGYGGVAMLVKKGIPYIDLGSVTCSIENIGIQVDKNLVIIAAYNPPSNKYRNTCLDKLLLTNRPAQVIIMGDLNSRHHFWNYEQNNISYI